MHGVAISDTPQTLIELHGVGRRYRLDGLEVAALSDVHLHVDAGEFVVVLGPSGSGKTTLLNLIGGLDAPTSGEITVRGTALTGSSRGALAAYRRKTTSFVFQTFNLFPGLTALENVRLVTEISERPMVPERALALVGLAERANHFPAQLSGGEQQRVAIARAIVKQPDVLLCDEPTGALDFQTGKLVLEVLDRVNRELHTTVAIITHNASIAALGDRVIRMHSGQIASVEHNAVRAAVETLQW